MVQTGYSNAHHNFLFSDSSLTLHDIPAQVDEGLYVPHISPHEESVFYL